MQILFQMLMLWSGAHVVSDGAAAKLASKEQRGGNDSSSLLPGGGPLAGQKGWRLPVVQSTGGVLAQLLLFIRSHIR